MSSEIPATSLQLRTLVKPEGVLEVSLASVPTPEPAANEVLLRVEAAPLNPSDLALLLGPADLSTLTASGTPDRPVVTATIPPSAMRMLTARLGQSLPAGNEGAGVVVRAGASPAAQALVGTTVAAFGGSMYGQYRAVPLEQCIPLLPGTTPAEGASSFVNPLTALGMVETMRREGHKALVHTAAASNLGQMLVRLCKAEGVPLVNVVRKPEQAALLASLGAEHVCDSSKPSFLADLTEALVATGATIGFDATGGGKLGGHILSCMESALNRDAKVYSRYGSFTHKQLYIYGGLDTSPTEFQRTFGLAWGMGGWLLTIFLQKLGAEGAQKLRERVAREIKTTFASAYSAEVPLADALKPEVIRAYAQRATGAKYLIRPNG